MSTLSFSSLPPSPSLLPTSSSSSSSSSLTPSKSFLKLPLLRFPTSKTSTTRSRDLRIKSKPTEAEEEEEEDEWLRRLPDEKKPLYSHSLNCIEAWIKHLGFYQNGEDRAVWFVEKPYWHAYLSLHFTHLYIRYLKSGPGNLEKDVERRFSYALSREDIENAVLGGP